MSYSYSKTCPCCLAKFIKYRGRLAMIQGRTSSDLKTWWNNKNNEHWLLTLYWNLFQRKMTQSSVFFLSLHSFHCNVSFQISVVTVSLFYADGHTNHERFVSKILCHIKLIIVLLFSQFLKNMERIIHCRVAVNHVMKI